MLLLAGWGWLLGVREGSTGMKIGLPELTNNLVHTQWVKRNFLKFG